MPEVGQVQIARIEIGPKPADARVFLTDGKELVGLSALRTHGIAAASPVYVDITALVARGERA